MDLTQLCSAVETTNQWWHIKSAGECAAAQSGERDRRGFSATVTDDPVFGDAAQLERLQGPPNQPQTAPFHESSQVSANLLLLTCLQMCESGCGGTDV